MDVPIFIFQQTLLAFSLLKVVAESLHVGLFVNQSEQITRS